MTPQSKRGLAKEITQKVVNLCARVLGDDGGELFEKQPTVAAHMGNEDQNQIKSRSLSLVMSSVCPVNAGCSQNVKTEKISTGMRETSPHLQHHTVS